MDAPRFACPPDGRLSDEMIAAYGRDGFLVLEDFATPEACALLRGRVEALVEAFDPEENRVAFSTSGQGHAAEDYFRGSGDKVRFFLEEGAVAADGGLDRPKARAVNKIGHALHDLDPIFAPFSRDPRLAEICADIGLADPALAQSMAICKQPEIGGEVDLHQDATFLHTEPVSVVGLWVALEAADRENGCLFALPGGHKDGLKRRFHYAGDDLADGDVGRHALGPGRRASAGGARGNACGFARAGPAPLRPQPLGAVEAGLCAARGRPSGALVARQLAAPRAGDAVPRLR
jgi:phytanoyl-CoA hydroxylase